MIEYPGSLEENGWQYYSKCVCGGALKYKFRNTEKKGFELSWWPRRYQFKITEKNKTVVGTTKITLLEETLKAL